MEEKAAWPTLPKWALRHRHITGAFTPEGGNPCAGVGDPACDWAEKAAPPNIAPFSPCPGRLHSAPPRGSKHGFVKAFQHNAMGANG